MSLLCHIMSLCFLREIFLFLDQTILSYICVLYLEFILILTTIHDENAFILFRWCSFKNSWNVCDMDVQLQCNAKQIIYICTISSTTCIILSNNLIHFYIQYCIVCSTCWKSSTYTNIRITILYLTGVHAYWLILLSSTHGTRVHASARSASEWKVGGRVPKRRFICWYTFLACSPRCARAVFPTWVCYIHTCDLAACTCVVQKLSN